MCFNLISPISCWHVSHLSSLPINILFWTCFEGFKSQRAPSRSFIPLRRLMTYVPLLLFSTKICSDTFPQTRSVPRKNIFWAVFAIVNIFLPREGQNVYDQLNVYCVGCSAFFSVLWYDFTDKEIFLLFSKLSVTLNEILNAELSYWT